MRPRLVAVVAGACFFVAVAFNLRGDPQQAASAAPAPATTSPAAERQAVLSKYCFMCHNEKLRSGGLALSTLGFGEPEQES